MRSLVQNKTNGLKGSKIQESVNLVVGKIVEYTFAHFDETRWGDGMQVLNLNN